MAGSGSMVMTIQTRGSRFWTSILGVGSGYHLQSAPVKTHMQTRFPLLPWCIRCGVHAHVSKLCQLQVACLSQKLNVFLLAGLFVFLQ